MARAQPGDISWSQRAYPGTLELLHSWSLRPQGSVRILLRRMFMWTILVLRVLMSILMIIYNTFNLRITSTAVGVVLTILNFFFVIWCLSMIDRAEGFRHVLGLRIGRNHLDIFLGICAALHVVLLSGMWTFIGYHTWFWSLWLALWGLIAVYGFICTASPDSNV